MEFGRCVKCNAHNAPTRQICVNCHPIEDERGKDHRAGRGAGGVIALIAPKGWEPGENVLDYMNRIHQEEIAAGLFG